MSTILNEGDKAPAFKAKNENGETVSLKDFAGKKLILYFYPKDDTPGCTKEACNFRDNFSLLKKQGYAVLGVSTDSPESHKKFIAKYQLPFSLLADEDKKIVKAYGVWGAKQLYGRQFEGIHRTTFVINEKGIIERIIRKVETAKATEQILNLS